MKNMTQSRHNDSNEWSILKYFPEKSYIVKEKFNSVCTSVLRVDKVIYKRYMLNYRLNTKNRRSYTEENIKKTFYSEIQQLIYDFQ